MESKPPNYMYIQQATAHIGSHRTLLRLLHRLLSHLAYYKAFKGDEEECITYTQGGSHATSEART